ncbi:MAG: dihydropteroate synthase [Candidatus Pelagibacter sp. TMED286]|nr:MAG: dihydropteroate synthase [Candidatus Pelagibacter sp. TMED286]
MIKYYTRVCNFYFGSISIEKVKKKLTIPLHGNKLISFDTIEILSRKSIRRINIKKINILENNIKKKILLDISKISKKKKFKNLKFSNLPILMGVLNLTPNSFSDGGRYNKKNLGVKHAKKLIKDGCGILDIGGEATNPGSKEVNQGTEWKRLFPILKKIKNFKIIISLDSRKSKIMRKGIKNKISLVNDVSGFEHDPNTIKVLKDTNIPFVIHHMQGNPSTMQKNPKYNNVVLDIYDYFEKKIKYVRSKGIKHNNIILDPGIGFGKNLKHNITLLKNISIYHSLGLPIMLGTSRKRFIKNLSGVNDSKERLGGTISSSLLAIMQGVQILRVHDVNEVNQSIKVFNSLKF